jgi:hypothetical protein
MSQVKLIVAADEPAIFFASVRSAERWIEPSDVIDGVYRAAFGPNGEPYIIRADGNCVTIQEAGGAPQPEALRAVLLQYFTAIGETPSKGASLSELLARCTPSYS